MIKINMVDVSASTDARLYSSRRRLPIGAMMHTTDGKNSLAYLQRGSINDGRYASCDYLIVSSGVIYSLMPEGKHSYHAGICRYNGIVDNAGLCNRLFVGIEVENYDRNGEVPNDAQHVSAAALLLHLAAKYKWSPLKVYGHYGLAHPMGRRSDPHQWDWGYMFWLMHFRAAELTIQTVMREAHDNEQQAS